MTEINKKLAWEIESALESQRILYLDLTESAEALKNAFGKYLKPYTEPIYYLEHAVQPTLDFTRNKYECYPGIASENLLAPADKSAMVPATDLSPDLPGDIFSELGHRVLRKKNFGQVSKTPWFALREMQLIEVFVADLAFSRIPMIGKARSREKIIEDFLAPDWKANFYDTMSSSEQIEFCDEIWLAIQPTLNVVREFMGPDKWLMHFVRLGGTDLVVEKTVDYRIYDWTHRVKSGEWKTED